MNTLIALILTTLGLQTTPVDYTLLVHEMAKLDVPITSVTTPVVIAPIVITVPDNFMDPAAIDVFNHLADILYNIQDGKNIVLVLNVAGYGGRLDAVTNIINALKTAESNGLTVHINVTGPAYSAHALLACAGNTPLSITPTGSLMFHSGGQFVESLGGLLLYKTNGSDDLNMESEDHALHQLCVTAGVLTAKEVKDIENDKEVIKIPSDGMLLTVVASNRYSILMGICNAIKSGAYLLFLISLYLGFIYSVIRVSRVAWRG